MFKVLCWGGIGDALRNLLVFPHDFIYRKTGIRTGVLFKQVRVVSGESVRGAALAHAKPPSADFFQELVSVCPSLYWDRLLEMHESHREAGIVANRIVREIGGVIGCKKQFYYPFYPVIESSWETGIQQLRRGKPLIGIQTHLSGMRTKYWDRENWKKFIEGLLSSYPKAQIVLVDTAPEVDSLVFDDRISTTRGCSIAESIRLVQRLDYLVSVDSWSKYVAVASAVPQTIVVPDQRPEYPVLEAEQLLSQEFKGIYGRAEVDVLGLESHPARLTLPRMADLSAGYLLQSVLTRLRAMDEKNSVIVAR